AGFLTPQSSGLIQQLFSGAERGRAFGYFGLTVSIASATGPLLGGLVIGLVGEDLGWRLLFLVNVPIGLVAAIAVARMVPGRQADGGPGRIDVPGAVLLGLSVLCLLYPLVSLESGARWPLVLLLGVPLFGWAFGAWEHRLKRRGHEPLLDLDLLRRLPGFGNGMLVGTVYFTGFTGVFLVASVWLQGSRDVSALHAGLLLTPFALGSAITSPLAGRLVSTVGRSLTVGALIVMMVGVLGAALVAPGRATDELWWALAPFLLLAGLGGGAVVSPNITLTLQEVPPRMGGAAGGALQTGQRIGSSLGAALLATTYQVVAGGSGGDTGIRVALFVALAVLALALAAAVLALRSSRRLAGA
ncbi:MAG: MFS transporter, partial [Actinomycetales bacterium]